ncbi:hypothetical protein ACHAXR_005230 [Thalassiosira sp. AJA248-18]
MNENQQQYLTKKLAARLVQGDESLKPTKACIAIAGGGSNAAAAIASIPGATSLLLEFIGTCDGRQNIVQEDKENGDTWLMGLESSMEEQTNDAASLSTQGKANNDDSSFTSKERSNSFQQASAILLSRSALHRSLQLTPSFQDRSLHCIGLGCTSLLGKLTDDGGLRKISRAYIACSTLREGTWVWVVELDSSGTNQTMEGAHRRSRLEEEAVISNLILLALIQYREQFKSTDNDSDESGTQNYQHLLGQILDREGDSVARRIIDGGRDGKYGKSPSAGASQIINGDASIVAVLPVTEQRMEAVFSDNKIPFPQDVLIFPGSFNPPHQGHIRLVNAAVSALRRLRRKGEREITNNDNNAITSSSSRPYSRYPSFSSVSPSSTVLKKDDPTVFFEMSATNPDKPPSDPLEVERRVNLFTSILPTSGMPQDWAVILTYAPFLCLSAILRNASLISQNRSILDELLAGNSEGSLSSENQTNRKVSFVMGTDTMARIINPKYYGNSRDSMLAALVYLKEKGVHFIVGGRLEQGTENKTKFVNGKKEVKSLPPGVQDMFTLLTEEEFRLDISSTELRKRRELNQ